ncbi:peptide ABC transporter ATP-binding protein [Reinekea blandensis]|uniref:Putative ATP-binding component of dipeptide transport system n=1 Tax=Reinekea blandensis MED297 TaxID=314283 RepID=A4BKU0_9GAMM|nr:peptide ABC transporter ATP-binding protein [Reinekea blandensis]EAR07260.1 putative ATP-binding component of dipeptide transport system [Reinekea sp. MED297] [Reinekea blandensis MED297]
MTASEKNIVLQGSELKQHYEVSQGPFKPKGVVKALDGVDFKVEAGKTLAVVGESGCGKSTLARQLTMIETPTAGRIEFNGKNLLTLTGEDKKEARERIQIIFQNPYGSLNPRKKIGQILEEPLVINSEMNPASRKERALYLLEKVGLKHEHYDRYPHMFSGGQRQRIAIARGLMMNPKVVVADEPVSALDVSVQAQVLNLMMDIQKEFGLAYIFISHDLSVVEHIADEVMVMYLGRVVEQGPTHEIFSQPKHPYTRALLSSTPRINPEQRIEKIRLPGELPSPMNPPLGCAFHGRCQYANDRCKHATPELVEDDKGTLIRCFGYDEGRLDYLNE